MTMIRSSSNYYVLWVEFTFGNHLLVEYLVFFLCVAPIFWYQNGALVGLRALKIVIIGDIVLHIAEVWAFGWHGDAARWLTFFDGNCLLIVLHVAIMYDKRLTNDWRVLRDHFTLFLNRQRVVLKAGADEIFGRGTVNLPKLTFGLASLIWWLTVRTLALTTLNFAFLDDWEFVAPATH